LTKLHLLWEETSLEPVKDILKEMETGSEVFVFVVENSERDHQVRSHVMKGSWKTRKARHYRQPKIRNLTPKTIVQDPQPHSATSTEICGEGHQINKDALLTLPEDLLHKVPIAGTPPTELGRPLASSSGIPRSGYNSTLSGSWTTPGPMVALKNNWTIEFYAPFRLDTTIQPDSSMLEGKYVSF
jgi:hypothetical protein